MKRPNVKLSLKKERKHRISLTLLFAGVILAFLIVTLLFAILIGYILIETGAIKGFDESTLTPMRTFLLLAVASLAVGFILATCAGRFPMKPVNKIISQLNRLASGDFSARLDFKGTFAKIPAIKEACDSFNKMAEELGKTEMLRGDFVNNFSHEFKTPIVSIAGFAKLLKRGNLTDEQKNEYITIIEEESLRLSNLATNMLCLTKYENQSILTDVSCFNLSEQIRSSIVTLEGKWSKKNIEFDIEFGEFEISADREMLRHVWINLIDNAVKFSPEGGKVEIGIKKSGGDYEVSVTNSGGALPTEQKNKIFNKFYQADESHATEGNGIGLAVVKGVTELHGGRVEAEFENGRVTFTVTLPTEQ